MHLHGGMFRLKTKVDAAYTASDAYISMNCTMPCDPPSHLLVGWHLVCYCRASVTEEQKAEPHNLPREADHLSVHASAHLFMWYAMLPLPLVWQHDPVKLITGPVSKMVQFQGVTRYINIDTIYCISRSFCCCCHQDVVCHDLAFVGLEGCQSGCIVSSVSVLAVVDMTPAMVVGFICIRSILYV